jgi:periplasmic protein TonB
VPPDGPPATLSPAPADPEPTIAEATTSATPTDPPVAAKLPEPEPAVAPAVIQPAAPPSPPTPSPSRKPEAHAPSPQRRAPLRAAESAPVPTAFARLSPPAPDLPFTPPRPVAGLAGNRPPVYPERARQRGEEGHVMLRVDVSTEGNPTAVSITQSSGHLALDEAAVAAVRRWRFVAATRGGIAVPGAAEVPVRFTLAD